MNDLMAPLDIDNVAPHLENMDNNSDITLNNSLEASTAGSVGEPMA